MKKRKRKRDPYLDCQKCGGKLYLVDGYAACGDCASRLGQVDHLQHDALLAADRLIKVSNLSNLSVT